MKNLKSLLIGLVALAASFALTAQTVSQAITASTATTLLTTSGYIIDSITFTASTSTNTTVKIYDSSSATTNIVRPSYSNWTSYATNFDSVFTNESGILVTNTFSGRWTYPTTVAAVTNERPRVFNFVVPGSTQRTKETVWTPLRGVTIFTDQAGVVEVNYRPQ